MVPMSNLILYTTEDGRSRIQLRAQEQTVWLTQLELAELFATSKQNIGQHLKRILAEGELTEASVVKQHFTTAATVKEYLTVLIELAHPNWAGGLRRQPAQVAVRDRVGPVPVTAPLRTLEDCAAAHLPPDLLRDAARSALARGLVSRGDLAAVEAALAPFGGLGR
jgi:hypothetical protein